MEIRNEILIEIVTAEGGTVTDPNNRNTLLADILTARGGSPTGSETRNELLSLILETYASGEVFPFTFPITF